MMKQKFQFLLVFFALVIFAAPVFAQNRRGGSRQARANPAQTAATFQTAVPARPFDLTLARPERDSICFAITANEAIDGYITYGTAAGNLNLKTETMAFKPGAASPITIRNLKPDTQYYYRFHWRRAVSGAFSETEIYSFHTQRAPGRPFTFTITADSHLDEKTDTRLYARTLQNAAADTPDFHIDLGDTFMTEKHSSRQTAARQYLAQRYYFGLIGRSAPVFLVLGNHDGESARDYDAKGSSLAAWSNLMRTKYFPNPAPDSFYSGNRGGLASGGTLEDYYAWTWGDALFVVLDPYWFSARSRGQGDGWSRSLGETQYRWLEKTLSQSNAKYKFVFLHNLVGGLDNNSRGGIEIAPYYEWGGRDADGKDTFAAHRSGWSMPIRQLSVKHRVTVVFHGHDHLFAKQDLDGVVYQEVPQPGFAGRWNPERAREAGYTHGTILGGSGHIRVDVSPSKTNVAFIGATLPENNTPNPPKRRIVFQYDASPRR